MGCETVMIPGGGRAIVCSSTRRCACGRRATSPAAGKDLCPTHADAFAKWKAAR